NSCGTPPEGSPRGREEGHADGRDSRQPVDPHGGGRRRTGLRRGEKGHRPEASLGRRHARDGARGCRSKRLLAGPRRGLLCPDATARTVPTDQSSFRRQRLWPERSAGVGPRHIRLGAANRAPSGRSERLRRAAQTLDRGTHVRLAGSVSPAQPRLREDHRLGRSDDLHRHDQLDVQTPRAKRKLIFKTRSQDGYAFLWQANRQQRDPDIVAVARPRHLALTGETIALDATRSWSRGRIVKYEWTFGDGTTATGRTVERSYDRPGMYNEILTVADDAGRTGVDFAVVKVVDRDHPEQMPPGLHATFHPSLSISPGDPVTFTVRARNTVEGRDTWDFGDGSEPVVVRSNID